MEAGRCVVFTENPDCLAKVPPAESFTDDYMLAPDLERIGDELIQRRPELEAAREASIRYVWRKKHGTYAGMIVLGKCEKVSGSKRAIAKCDYIIHAAADVCREQEFPNWQLEALIYHELLHVNCQLDDNGKKQVKITGHDVEMFRSEVERYGLWRPNLEAAAQTFRQLDLLAGVLPEEEYDRLVEVAGKYFSADGIEETDPKKIARLLRRDGFPVRYNDEARLYVNPGGDAYAEGIVESEFHRLSGK